jgi:uncharacterized membrane protein
MLVSIPIGLWVFSLACDLIRVFGGTSENWEIVALYTMIGGVVGALAAAVPGFIDMLSLPPGIRRIALIHMSLNLTIVVLYIINSAARLNGQSGWPVWLSVIAIAMLLVSGWLGGQMIYVHGVAVETPPEPASAKSRR